MSASASAPPLPVSIRRMLPADIPDIARLGSSFVSDPLFNWVYPGLDKYPSHMYLFQLVRNRARILEVGVVGSVAEMERDGKREIVGYTFWRRHGDDEGAREWRRDTWWRGLERRLLGVEMRYHNMFVQRAKDLDRAKRFGEANAKLDEAVYDHLGAHWDLTNLGVDASVQRRGIGSKLLEWGLEQARKEGVPVTLEASPVGLLLYEKKGFKTVKRIRFGEEEGLEEIAMIWEPENLQGKWLEGKKGDEGVEEGCNARLKER